MTQRRNFSSASMWEPVVGYSRAVRVGNLLEVAGTCAVADDGSVFAEGDPYQQARRCLEIIRRVIESAGGEMHHVIRTRMYVTDINHFEEIGKAHGEVFGDIRPASTLVEVSALVSPAFLVEIEATAYIIGDEEADV